MIFNDARKIIFDKSIVIASLFVSALVGAMVAVVPVGLLFKLLLPLIALLVFVIAWGSRQGSDTVLAKVEHLSAFSIVILSVIWPRYIYFHVGGMPGLNPFTLGIVFLLGVIVVNLASSELATARMLNQCANAGVILKLFIVMVVWGLIASITGEEPIFSTLEYVKSFVYISSFFVFGLIVAGYKNGPETTLKIVVLFGVLVCFLGILEAHLHQYIFVNFSTESQNSEAAKVLAGLAADKTRGGIFRAQSTFDHPIVFAQFVAALVPLAAFLAMNTAGRFWKFIGWVAIPFALLAIASSGSRSGYFSLAAAISCMALIWFWRTLVLGGKTKILALAAIPAFVFSSFVLVAFLQNLVAGRNQHESGSSNIRLTMVNDGLAALTESPILGFGHGLAVSKAGATNPAGLSTIDNYFLSLALDYGYVGLALFFAIVLIYVIKCLRFSVKGSAVEHSFVGACCASVLAIFVTFFALSIPQNLTLCYLLICITLPFLRGAKL